MNSLERLAVEELVAKASAAGHKVSLGDICNSAASWAARTWAETHPDGQPAGCCYGEAHNGLEGCYCWEPVYDVDQAPLQKVTGPDDLGSRPRMCSDCAYRKDSPERAEEWTDETLLSLPERGDPFWCHDGIRRPVAWVHPVHGRLEGTDPADYKPPIVGNVPYRADGRPALLCAGWMSRRLKALDRQPDAPIVELKAASNG